MVYDVRGWFLISMSVLEIWAALPAFQELINCCAWRCSQQKAWAGSLQRVYYMWVWDSIWSAL